MNKSLLGKVLRVLMFQKNINVSQLARETKVPQQTLQRLVSGASTNPHEKTIKALADFFKLSEAELKGEKNLPTKLNNSLNINAQPSIKQIPVFEWEMIEKALMKKSTVVPTEYIFVQATLSEDVFALIMNDSSMEPYIPEKSTLIFSQKKAYKDRGFVLAKLQHNNAVVFRQILVNGHDKYLKPMNSDLNAFQMHALRKKDKLLGTLVEYRHCY